MFLWEREGEFNEEEQFYRVADRLYFEVGRGWHSYIRGVPQGGNIGCDFYNWRKKYSGLLPSEMRRLRQLEEENGNRPWTDSEREIVMATLPAHMKLPIALMMYCGLDPQDAIKLSRTSVKDNKIDTKRGKTEGSAWFNLPADVVAALEAAPKHSAITLCANRFGKPWTVSGFSASWTRHKGKLVESKQLTAGLTLKGLRHTVGTILAEMGYDDRAIADILMQETTQMARHYSKRADRTQKGNAIVKNFDAELNRRRTKAVKPS